MQVRLLAFATASDALGSNERQMELEDGARVADLEALLCGENPAWTELWPRLAVAVNGQVADPERELEAGDEVALLPPVSGGSGGTASHLTREPIDLEQLRRQVADPGSGAVVLFLGTVRNHHAGRRVERLTYTAYDPMAESRLARIVAELQTEAGARLAILHRLGTLEPGQASVAIASAAPHRDAAYRANRRALERLKREVPIWKREHYAEGDAAWREEESLCGPTSGP